MTVRVLGVRGLLSMAAASVVAMTTAGWTSEARGADVGVVSHINIVSDKSEDVSSPEAWKKAYIKDGMTDQEKAIAIWKTMVRYRHQDAPPNEGLEGNKPVTSWEGEKEKGVGNVHEPFKTIHVYGYGMCCCVAADIEGLARYIGLPARGRAIQDHSVPEVYYNNSWHLFDASLCFFLQKPGADGKPATGDVASVDEMRADIQAWRKKHPEIKDASAVQKFAVDNGWKNGPSLFATCNDSPTAQLLGGFYNKDGWCRAEAPVANGPTNHGWNSNIVEYNYKNAEKDGKAITATCAPDNKEYHNPQEYGPIMGYELNVQLREGEKITRNWGAKEVATGVSQRNEKRYQKFLEGDMTSLSLQQALGDKNPGRIGNGVLEYDVLADSKLAADALACENLKIADGKIRIVDASKPATLVVRMPSSYVYLNGEMTATSVVGTGGSVTASISVNNGMDWKPLGKYEQSGDQKADLKPIVFNKYDYRVKFEIAGAGSGLDALKLTDSFQHSQAPLPVITEGDNKINFSAGSQEGTITVQGTMAGAGAALSIDDFHPVISGLADKRFSGNGSAIIPVATPGDATRVRMSINWRARDEGDGYTISVSSDEGKNWKEMGKLGVASPGSTSYLTFSDIPAGTKKVQVKFDANQKNTTCIFSMRLDVDYKEPAGGFRPVKVTYAWEEGAAVAAPAADPAPAPADKGGKAAKGDKGDKGGKKGGKAPAPAEKPHGTLKTSEHICNSPTDSWTITCGAGTVAKSYTVELVK